MLKLWKSKYLKGDEAYNRGEYARALKYWEDGAKNDPACIVALGRVYQNGIRVPQDLQRALRYFIQAAEQNYPNAYYDLGDCYLEGIGVERDVVKGLDCMKKAISLGSGFSSLAKNALKKYEAEYNAELERRRNHVVENPRPVDKGADAYAKGCAYASGDGVPQDFVKAIYWLQVASDEGNTDAMRDLAGCYVNGAGVEKNEAKAFELYRKLAEGGDADAQFAFAGFYLNGKVVAYDIAEGAKWLGKAADQGHCQAQLVLGMMYYQGENGDRDYAKAFHYLTPAARQGDLTAKCALGYLYFYGDGVERDYELAYDNLVVAYQGGMKTASHLLGLYHLSHSRDTDEDHKKAFDYLNEAVSIGIADAYGDLAYCYAVGCGVKRDQAEAFKLYGKVCDNGTRSEYSRAEAAYNMGMILLANNGVNRNVTLAVDYLRLSKSLGNKNASYRLGLLYYFGASQDGKEVLAREENTAYLLFMDATRKGIAEARMYLNDDCTAVISRSKLRLVGFASDVANNMVNDIIETIGDSVVNAII